MVTSRPLLLLRSPPLSSQPFVLVLLLLLLPSMGTSLSVPPDMSSPTSCRTYDLVVIGGGSAGLTAAKFASKFGFSSVIIERSRLGGDCTWSGCVPSKSLIASGRVAHSARNAGPYGVETGIVKVDMTAVRDRLRRNMQRIYEEDDSPEAMAELGVDTLEGDAAFASSDTLVVTPRGGSSDDTVEVRARDGIVVATGARPRKPRIDGIDDVEYITYEQVFDLDVVPGEMTVVGGGPIGCELAQVFGRLGARVTLIATRLLPRSEPEVSEALAEIFEGEGITLVKGRAKSVRPEEGGGGGGHTVTCSLPDGSTTAVSGDLLLAAAGREPVTSGMNLEGAGVDLLPGGGGIRVDSKLRTSAGGVYAAGDCTGGAQFTHYAGYQGAVAARNALLPLSDAGVSEYVPGTTFTDPECAGVGMTEGRAREVYGDGAVGVKVQMVKEIDRAVCDGKTEGLIKIVYRRSNYKILGAALLCPAAGEMASEIAVAMKGGITFDALATVMHAYPSYSFALQVMAADVYYGKLLKLRWLLNLLKKIGL